MRYTRDGLEVLGSKFLSFRLAFGASGFGLPRDFSKLGGPVTYNLSLKTSNSELANTVQGVAGSGNDRQRGGDDDKSK